MLIGVPAWATDSITRVQVAQRIHLQMQPEGVRPLPYVRPVALSWLGACHLPAGSKNLERGGRNGRKQVVERT
jgi:hypothetical protein